MTSFFNSHNTKYLMVLSLFCSSLLLIRYLSYVEGANFAFLLFNLFLAWIPYFVSQLFRLKNIPKAVLFLIFIIWLLFFPNALYVITDLFQIWPRPKGSVWFDLIMVSSFAFTSLFLGFGSLMNIEQFIGRKIKGGWKLNLLIFFLMYLGSFGVYMGRFRRWNSWDVITNATFLKREGLFFFENPFEDIDFYATTFVFASFCYLLYYGVFHFGKNHK